MDLIGYLRLLRRRWWIIALAVLVSVAAAMGATRLQHERYKTSTRLLVSGSSSLSAVDEITRRQLAQQRAVLFAQIATTDPVVRAAEQAADDAGTGKPVESAGPAVTATASGSDPFLTITVAADTAQAAQAVANIYAKILPGQLAKLDQLPSVVDTLLTTVNPAGLPTQPFAPRPLRNALIGLALGLVLGIAAALIRETLDTTLRDSEEVRRITRATILGIIPREFDDERLPAATRPHSRRSEAYRQVRTNLEFAAGDEAPRSFVITSAGQGEGKSTTVANLALLISRAGKRVAIVDGDLRKPTLASFFNATSDFGLSDVLTGRSKLGTVMQPIAGEQIAVLASGPTVARPSELLSSPAMEQVLAQLRSEFDLVIVDSPPVLAITDALLVGKHTDGMIVVTRMRRTTRSGLRRSLEAVERVHAQLLGVVINGAVDAVDKRYGYDRGYLSQRREADQDLHPTEQRRAAEQPRQPEQPRTPEQRMEPEQPWQPEQPTAPEPDDHPTGVLPRIAERPEALNGDERSYPAFVEAEPTYTQS
ncbi:MAG: tyrosine-protein kinase, partial [Pseudonocardiales bacterium]|nr:tyrosine-protein kinase [Pseudonocardiales bacterium]